MNVIEQYNFVVALCRFMLISSSLSVRADGQKLCFGRRRHGAVGEINPSTHAKTEATDPQTDFYTKFALKCLHIVEFRKKVCKNRTLYKICT